MSASRELVKVVVGEKPRAGFGGECAYCGARCFGYACGPHKDLPQLEHDVYSETNEPDRLLQGQQSDSPIEGV